MAFEMIGAAKWVSNQILATGARVYQNFAPDKDPLTGALTAYPFVVFDLRPRPDTLVLGSGRLAANVDVFWRVVGRGGGYEDIRQLASVVDAALVTNVTITVTHGGESYHIHGCTRIEPYMDARMEDGICYYSLGGIVRLLITT